MNAGGQLRPSTPMTVALQSKVFRFALNSMRELFQKLSSYFWHQSGARAVVRNLIIRFEREEFPLVWFQLGAEDEQAHQALREMDVPFIEHDCLVRFAERHSLKCATTPLPQQWFLQTASEDGDGCSIWSVHSSDSASLNRPMEALEWVGSLEDLSLSNHTIPRYIRSLKQQDETLQTLAVRLTGEILT